MLDEKQAQEMIKVATSVLCFGDRVDCRNLLFAWKTLQPKNWTIDEVTRRLQTEIMPAFNRRGNIELLVIVTPARTSVVYAPIKRYCDTVAGIASQCVVKFNVRRKSQDRGFAFNMLMKINSKLGGINV